MSKKILVYKGFDLTFLNKLECEPLVNSSIEDKLNYERLDFDYKNRMNAAIFDSRNECWITYEEFELDYDSMESFVASHQISITIINNNVYPGLYPCNVMFDNELYDLYREEREDVSNKTRKINTVDNLNFFYSDIQYIDGKYYCSYHNLEYNNPAVEKNLNYYSDDIEEVSEDVETEYIVDIGDDLSRYIFHINTILINNYKLISYKKICSTNITENIFAALKAFCNTHGINKIYKQKGESVVENDIQKGLIEVAQNVLKKENFSFRQLKFYANPDLSNDIENVSQGELMEYIVGEAEKAYKGEVYRDIFMTAPTGAGKSLIFQIPAIYLANKYNKLIIIIEPLKSLMNDQQANLRNAGYKKAAYLNSDLNTLTEKEKVISDVKNGNIDLLYLSPETLLSHSIDSLIGEREIGLVIIDEAHIVTTWGVGFRPDYWYLGSYINKLRTAKDKAGKIKKYFDFPIFACTATAVNGGKDDTVSDTFISLYMRDPIRKIGYAKRDDIEFDIHTYLETKTYDKYKSEKVSILGDRIASWIKNKDKTIVYCPYSKDAHNMKNGSGDYVLLGKFRDNTGVYTGGAYDTFEKNEYMTKFKNGDINVMYATKAFGMGIDIPDIHNVYHYAVTGGLSDYLQEIGRAARKPDITGRAIVDYFKGDMKFTNTLFGMSQIRQYQVKRCLSIIYDVFCNKRDSGVKNPYSFMINPKMFNGVFGKYSTEDDTANKLKIVLLMLEKDFYDTFGIPVLISRPGSMFTETFVVIDRTYAPEILRGQYGRYFSRVGAGRKNSEDEGGRRNLLDGVSKTTDCGDAFKLNLKKLWEDKYSDMSFAAFKYFFYSKSKERPIIPDIRNHLYGRIKLDLRAKNGKLDTILPRAKDDIDFITNKLNEFGREFFTKEEFKKKLMERYKKASKAEIIANSYLDIVDPNNYCVKNRSTESTEMYQISNGSIRSLAESKLMKSSLVKGTVNNKGDSLSIFIPDVANETTMDALKLLSLLDIIVYELKGGDAPEIFIRLNTPDKIRNIVEERTVYRNKYVDEARTKHNRSVKIIDYFFSELKDDETRWNFIEQYFLGEDIEAHIDGMKNEKGYKEKVKEINAYIDIDSSYPLDDYENWDDVYNNFIREQKYKYFCNIMSDNGVPLPDFASTSINIGKKSFKTLFIYSDKNAVVVSEDVPYEFEKYCDEYGWVLVKIDEIEKNIEYLKDK